MHEAVCRDSLLSDGSSSSFVLRQYDINLPIASAWLVEKSSTNLSSKVSLKNDLKLFIRLTINANACAMNFLTNGFF